MVIAVIAIEAPAAARVLAPLGGRPVLAWSLASALAAKSIDRIVVLSPDADVRMMVESLGVECHPTSLSCSDWLAQFSGFETLAVELSPAAPFHTGADIDAAVALLERSGCDAVVGTASPIDAILPDGRHGQVYPSAGLRVARSAGRAGKDALAVERLLIDWPRAITVDDEQGFELARMVVLASAYRTIGTLPLPDSIALICYDFDGVMTDNTVTLDEDGKESVSANRGDGLAIAAIRALGIPQVILSTEENKVVRARAAKLKIEVFHGLPDKALALRTLVQERGIDLDNVIYVGNDVNDLGAMQMAGYAIAPSDAHRTILVTANYVTDARGGYGVIREMYDAIFVKGA